MNILQKNSFPLLVSAVLLQTSVFGQTGVALEKLKTAAESGDATSQDSLAGAFVCKQDEQQAETWYRRAAAQGFAHAEGRLANILFKRARSATSSVADNKADLGTEAIRWATLAANQGDHRGQTELAEAYLDGVYIQSDLVAAYKWGEACPTNLPPSLAGRCAMLRF